jgi:cell division protein FtsI (penicillin-binding protein 3)
MKVREKKWIRFRIYLVSLFFLIGLGITLARAYQLQVLEKDRLGAIARAGYRGIIKLPPKRGTIYDREGHEMAVSVEVGSIYAHPNLVKDKINTSEQLSLTLDVPKHKILPLLESNRSFVWIKRKIPSEKARQVTALGLEGVGHTTETRRFYPGRDIASHLLGFTGADNQGLEGLETKYDQILKGSQYSLVKMRDALGRPFFISRPTSYGHEIHNIILTIDKDIQYKAQQALASAIKRTKAKSGQCLILNPHTGEILAMAVFPFFNPNIFWKYQPSQWRNRTVTDCYEPGSTMKAFLLAAALEEKIVSPNTTFWCERGEFEVAGHIIHDTKKYGSLSVSDIIIYSSNIGAIKIGQEIGYEKFCEYLRRFGFGSKTGVDIIGERKGFIRSFKNAKEVDQATIFFGQGMLATSLQLSMAMAAIANGGKLMKPFVVRQVLDQAGRVVKENRPQIVRRVLSLPVAKRVAQILEGVVSEKGTGQPAAISGFPVAGKTGTSQKVDPRTKKYSEENYVAIFVGFVPTNRPELLILVLIDEPKGVPYGGLVAGPVFREIGEWTLNNLRIKPQLRLAKIEDESESNEAKGSAFNQEQEQQVSSNGLLPDFRGKSMREVLKGGRSLGLQVVLEGTGHAVDQIPRSGTSLKNITTVKVKFRSPM